MILIGNGMVITQDVKNPFITNGAVVLKDNLILEAFIIFTLLKLLPIYLIKQKKRKDFYILSLPLPLIKYI